MRKHVASVVMMVAAAAMQLGCGESVDQAAIERAMESIDDAFRGYVPGDAQDADLRAHRRQVLADADAQLQPLATSGPQSQQILARRMQATIDAAAAHEVAREASLAYSTLAPRAVNLLSHVAVADRALARAEALDLHQPELIAALRTEIESQTARQRQLKAEAAKLNEQLQAEQAALAKVQKKRDQAAGNAQKLREQAFIADGEEGYDLADQAADQQRQADIATAEMERHQLSIDMLDSQLSVVDSQLKLTDDLLAELNERVKVAQQRQQEIEQAVAAAGQDRDAALTALATQFEQVLSAYRQQVDQPLTAATERMNQAIEALRGAADLSASGPRVDADLLAAMTSQAQMLAEHRQVVSGLHQTLTLVSEAVARLDPQQAAPFVAAVEELAAKKAQLATQATQTIASARQLAGELLGATNVADLAQNQIERLERLETMIAS